MKRFLFLIAFFACCSLPAFAQTFGAEIVGGLTMSQINGDGSDGYNKIGFTGGLHGLIFSGEKSYLSIGILAQQRGSQNELNLNNTPALARNFKITLNYIEVPLLFHYRDWIADEDSDFYRLDFHGGLSYGRLMGATLQDDIGEINELSERLKEDDLTVVLGAGYHITPNWSVIFQYRHNIVPLYRPEKLTNNIRGNWIGHLLSLQAGYTF